MSRKKNKKNIYNNRELSWLDFDSRILEEANDIKNPIMECAKFLGISASNLDEFFMVRVSGLLNKIEKKSKKKDIFGMKFKKVFKKLEKRIHKFSKKQYKCYSGFIIPKLKKVGIRFLSIDELDESQKIFLKKYFREVVYPVLTPLAIDTGRPFPFLIGRNLNIAVELENDKNDMLFGVVSIPNVLKRYIKLPGEENNYVLLENLIEHEIHSVFELYNVVSTRIFRVTRNSDLDVDEGALNLLQEVKNTIKKRKRGDVIRLEISHHGDKRIKRFLTKNLNVKRYDVYELDGPLDLSFLSKFYRENWDPELKFKPDKSVNVFENLSGEEIFNQLRKKDVLVCHPFNSFSAVVDFVKQASNDPNVVSIKQTLYRVSGNSPIVDALIEAVDKGKQVTAFVELKARFDEENNILWAQKLENSGCHVIHGIPGYKIHCKCIMIVRKEGKNIRRYIHLGTGNYNDITSKFYTDIGLFTSNKKIADDVSNLFNFLTGFSENKNYKKLIVSPYFTRNKIIELIDSEIKNVKKGSKGKIIIKVNALIDKPIIDKLYEASNAGVKIRLIVRGMCGIVPGVIGMSENIKVRSLVGKLLEHSRIFYFENLGDPQLYVGSADLMKRNLDKRVEVLFPLEDQNVKDKVISMLKVMLDDNVNAREQDSHRKYRKIIVTPDKKKIDSHSEFFTLLN